MIWKQDTMDGGVATCWAIFSPKYKKTSQFIGASDANIKFFGIFACLHHVYVGYIWAYYLIVLAW